MGRAEKKGENKFSANWQSALCYQYHAGVGSQSTRATPHKYLSVFLMFD